MRSRKKTPRRWAVRWISSAGRCSAKGRLWAWRKSWRMAKAGRRGTRALDWLIEDLLCSRRTDYRHDSAGGLLPKDRYGKDLRLIQCHSEVGKRTAPNICYTRSYGDKARFPGLGMKEGTETNGKRPAVRLTSH